MSVITFVFFNDTATTEIYTLSLHDALPIFGAALESDCAHPEGACQPSDLEPYVAQAHDQYRRSLELSRRVVVPALLLFVAEQPRQTLGESQEAEEAELGQGAGVDPA